MEEENIFEEYYTEDTEINEPVMYHVTLSDGTELTAQSDGVGNMICIETLDKDLFSDENLARVTIEENGGVSVYENQTLRTFYHQNDGSTFIRIDEKNEMEKLIQSTVKYRAALDDERDMMLDLVSDQEYRLCLIELGII